jgi:radical SAM-linked protein
MTVQRFRVRFRKGERVRYISHLDVLRAWERAIRRAGLPLSYSHGFTPHPKIGFAAPLPLGFTGEAEVMDVSLDEMVPAQEFRCRLSAETTDDMAIVDVEEIAVTAPPPQAGLLWADYRVALPGVAIDAARRAVADFMAKTELSWSEERKERSRTYDLRGAVALLTVEAAEGGVSLSMRLQADQELTARPEQVVGALFPGLEAAAIARTGLVIAETSPAREAWRRKGQFES